MRRRNKALREAQEIVEIDSGIYPINDIFQLNDKYNLTAHQDEAAECLGAQETEGEAQEAEDEAEGEGLEVEEAQEEVQINISAV